jgi:hypothetical protein
MLKYIITPRSIKATCSVPQQYTDLHDIAGFSEVTSFGSVQISISINSHNEGEE